MTIEQKQCLLAYHGYYPASGIDGIWGEQSAAATEAFQRAFGEISVDGICEEETEKALAHAVAYGMPEVDEEALFEGIKYWTKEEFRCQCGGKYCDGYPATIDRRLLLAADEIRERLGAPAHRTSGLRCKTWNTLQGGVSDNRHMTGKALDFWVEGKTADQILTVARTIPQIEYCYAIDGECVHINT